MYGKSFVKLLSRQQQILLLTCKLYILAPLRGLRCEDRLPHIKDSRAHVRVSGRCRERLQVLDTDMPTVHRDHLKRIHARANVACVHLVEERECWSVNVQALLSTCEQMPVKRCSALQPSKAPCHFSERRLRAS